MCVCVCALARIRNMHTLRFLRGRERVCVWPRFNEYDQYIQVVRTKLTGNRFFIYPLTRIHNEVIKL